jgi:hypothetical protein
MSTAKQQQQQITWRRSQVLELTSKGYSQSDIARVLQVDRSVICRDISYLNQQSKENIQKYIDEKLPCEYEKCLVGLTAILREAWNTAHNAQDKREKIQALSLAKECYLMKLDLLTNATVIDDAIRFVSSNNKSKENLKSLYNNSNDDDNKKEESNDPDYYDEDKDQIEEEQQEEEEETGEIVAITTTTNQVF